MTKKFWKDWQNRIGETKEVYGWYTYELHDGTMRKEVGGNLISYLPFRILSAKFNNNSVDLKVEITSEGMFNRHHVENKYITLNRVDISTVYFK